MLRSGGRNVAIGGSEFLEQSMSAETRTNEIERIIEQEHQRSRLRWAAAQIRHEFKDRSWRAFWLTTLGDSTVVEAAENLDMSTGAVYAARSRIMRRLQDVAQNGDPHDEE